MRRISTLLLTAPLIVLAAACGSDGDSDDAADDTTAAEVADDSVTDDADAADEADSDGSDSDSGEAPAPPAASGGGTATLTLANGESFEFGNLLCTLEPQMAAGSEILFTAVSYDDPGIDITQFGDEGTVTGVASISVYDGNYETLWDANSMFGTPIELTLDGSTITGTASFIPEGDALLDPVDGEVVANC